MWNCFIRLLIDVDIMPGMAALFQPICVQPSKDFDDFLFYLFGFQYACLLYCLN